MKLNIGTKVRVKEIVNPDLTVSMDRIQCNTQNTVVTIVDITKKFYLVEYISFVEQINKNITFRVPIKFTEVEEINEDQ
jgi:hypothetical protein